MAAKKRGGKAPTRKQKSRSEGDDAGFTQRSAATSPDLQGKAPGPPVNDALNKKLQTHNEELVTFKNALAERATDQDKLAADIVSLFASTNFATILLDSDLRVRLFTPGTGRVLDLAANDIGRPVTDVSSRVSDENLIPDARTVLANLAPIEREIYSDNGACYLRRILPHRSADDGIEGVVVNFIDITERKRAEDALSDLHVQLEEQVKQRAAKVYEREERLRSVVATAPDATITIDKRGNMDSFNPAAERMFGYTKDEAIGQNVSMLMPSPYRQEHDGYIARYLKTREARIIGIGREVEARRKDGSTFPIELTVSEVDHLGLFTGFIHDISDRKRNETLLKESEERLRELTARLLTAHEDERRRVARELHDVIGQKLTLLRMQLDRSIPESADRPVKGTGSVPGEGSAQEIVEALAGYVRDLSHELHPSAVEHLGLAVALRKECEIVAKSSGREVGFHAAERVPRRLSPEIGICLYRVAQEALQNAVKHAGEGRIEVSLELIDGGLQLNVLDEGDGFHVDAERSEWGLGLVTMEERARVVDGKFEVESTPGEGTTVRCWVPLPQAGELE